MNRLAAPDIDTNQSWWAATARPDTPCPQLRGDVTADLIVVGGGFTGVSTAYHVSRRFPDRRVVLLEARALANGASGRNGGLMLNWINGIHLEDPGAVQRIYAVTKDGIDGIERLIKEHDLKVAYRRDGCVESVTDPTRAEAAIQRVEQLRGLGIPVEWIPGEAKLGANGVVGSILDTTAGQINGVDLLRAMKPLLLAQGVAIYEETPVVRIEEGKTVTVTTAMGTVRAPAIMLATNGYTPRLGYFRHSLFPLQSLVVAAPATSGVSGFSDDLDRIAYGGFTESGTMIFGGGSNASYRYQYGGRTSYSGIPNYAPVEEKMRHYFPQAGPISHRWTGTLGVTMSRVCAMGVRGTHKNVYYALGYSGHGVTLANLAGRVICDLYSDHHEPWADLPFYNRKLGFIPGEPFRWIGYHAFTAMTGKSPRRPDL